MKDINLDNEEYELDVEQAINCGVLTKKYKLDKSQILPGSLWKSRKYRNILIARIGDNKYSILCFDSGMLCEAFNKNVVSEMFSLEELAKHLEKCQYYFYSMVKLT